MDIISPRINTQDGVPVRQEERPVYLNLFKIKFPCPAIVSILHRISGVIIFLALPLLLYLLQQSLAAATSFDAVTNLVHQPFMKLVLWLVLVATVFHLIAGIRHLLMDFGCFESLKAGRATATLVLALGILIIILVGVWLW